MKLSRICLVTWLCGVGWACGDMVYLKSGEIYSGKVLEYNNGAFVIDLNGSTIRAQAIYVDRVEWSKPEPVVTTLPAPVPVSAPVSQGVASQEAPRPEPAVPAGGRGAIAETSGRLVLTTHWQARLGRGDLALGDTARLLSKCGTPQVDLKGKAITISGKITYLMPVQQAKKILGLGLSTRSPLSCAAFAPDSFFFHEFSGHFEDGFNRLFLITDYADQVVGIQWQDNTSRSERWFMYPDAYSEDWSLFNFVQNRKKGNPNWQVGFYVCSGSQVVMGYPPRERFMMGSSATGVNEGVVRVDSELYSITRDRYNYMHEEKSRERTRLLLAQPVVDLMLYIAQKARN